LVESYLLQQLLGERVEIIVQMTQVDPPRSAKHLEASRYNNLYMWGYRPTRTAIDTLHEIYASPVSSILERGDVSQRFAARWALQQWIDIRARRARKGGGTVRYVPPNLTFPTPYDAPLPPNILDPLLKLRVARFTGVPHQFDSRTQRLLRAMVDQAQRSGTHLAFVFGPLHPKVRAMLLKDDLLALAAYGDSLAANKHVSVIDATFLLSYEDFRDDVHLTLSGARRLTSVIADSLAARR
jgi:hypothetical protein